MRTLLCNRVGAPGCARGDSDSSVAQAGARTLGAREMTRTFFVCMPVPLAPKDCCLGSSQLSPLAAVCAPVDVAGLFATETYCPRMEPSDAKSCGAGDGTRIRCDVEAMSLPPEGAVPARSGMLWHCMCVRGEGLLELRGADVCASAVYETVPSGPSSEDSSCRDVPPRGVSVASWKRTRLLWPRSLERCAESENWCEWEREEAGEDGPPGDRTRWKGALTRERLHTRTSA